MLLTKSEATNTTTKTSLENYFAPFRRNVLGIQQSFESPFGTKKIVYADWTASGRLYVPIEKILIKKLGPFVANTHTETTATGSAMTMAYHHAKDIIKKHVGAKKRDILISSNSGMTGVINKFQRILGLKIHERYNALVELPEWIRPIVFCTHMEHHSNQTSWLETICDVAIIQPTADGLVDLEHLKQLLYKYRNRKTKIAAVTSCSNVTGIQTPYHEIAEIMHRHNGLCFVDFACSAPYIDINMHPENELQHLDAIYFSPHKFLGGPGSTGILVFDPMLYKNRVPDHPGGGTVDYTNPWGEHSYIEEIEAREDGGTPAFLQTIRVAFCTMLKDEMGVDNILEREHEMLDMIWEGLDEIPNLRVLADNQRERLGVISFYIEDLHFNLGVKILNDRYGIQVRGGCSCAGTYGHYLFSIDSNYSKTIAKRIHLGDLSTRPGWIRMSIHPIMTNKEIRYILKALKELAENHGVWGKDYEYNACTNEFEYIKGDARIGNMVHDWFEEKLI